MRRLREVFRAALAAAALALPCAASAQEPAPEGPLVERVDVLRNQYLQTETLLYYVSTKPGDRYDEVRVREDFRRLWDTGFLDDLLLDVRDGEKGKIVSFVVRERRRIQIVDYRGSKELTTTNIEDKLKEKDALIRIDTFYDPGKAKRVEEVIQQALEEKGLTFASVKHETKSVGAAGLQLSFVIDDGPKTKVKKISFTGNDVFSDGRLRGAMKKIKETGFFKLTWINGKNKFSEEKWSEDQEKLRDFYLNNGYVQATVGQPSLSYSDGKSGFFKKKPVKWLHVDIPVTEGEQYRVGEVKFEGLTVFKEDAVRDLFKLKTGDVYNDSRLKKGYAKLNEIYGSVGYFQMTGYTKRKPDPEKKVVDLTLTMEEDKKYYVGRIRFTGNETTRDKVIRREIYLNESDVFNTEALKLTLRRLNQLGYFKPLEAPPEITQTPGKEDHLDLTFKVEEQNRNQFTFGGGVSGLEGTFINASFATSNFLGLGETLSVYAQSGKRTKNYQLSITEPYFLDRPITLGADVFKRKIRYESFGTFVGYTQEGTGGGVTTGMPVGRFSRIFLNYGFEVVKISGLTTSSTGTPSDEPLFNPAFFGADQNRTESRVTPSINHNTIDSPFTPRSGRKLNVSLQVAGGPLGGTVDYFRPTVEGVLFIPHTRKTALGLRVEAAFITAFGDTRTLPYYQRFFLGGETQIRGVNIRTVGPVDSFNRALGGNKYALFNAEYYFDLFGPLRFLLFYDAGQAFLEEERIDIREFRTSTGAELRFFMPVINVPFRLIYAWNPQRDSFQEKSTFKFAVGTTF
ncbi:MAG TPA: outer membrane protein assembly factor BamA [Vicinamibacteria bacterium]|nr:outer membrane protein assembly factor BamA [Vicinamibacteria bacterium]